MSMRWMARTVIALACGTGLALLGCSYRDLGAVRLLQSLPGCG